MNTPDNPKVSIIVPTCNRASMLVRAVESVLAQTFTDFELIIVDDGSSDDTPQVVASLGDPRIKSLRHSLSRGPAAARNTGIASARGQYLAFLDDDDEFLPTKVEQQVRSLDAASEEVGLVYAWWAYVGPTGEITGVRCPTVEGYLFDEALMLRLILGIGSTSMIRASVIDVIGDFDEALARCEDLDFICRLSKHFRVALVPRTLTKLYKGHSQLSALSRDSSTELRDYILRHRVRFKGELSQRRRVRASLWRRLAVAELGIGNYFGAFRAVAAAFVVDPRTAYFVAMWLAAVAPRKLARRIPKWYV